MKMVRLLTRKSIWAWLPPSCTSWWHGQTFSSPCACVCAFRLPHALRIGRQFSGSSGISNAHSNLEFGILILFARSYCAGFLVELQNQGWRFVSGLASKALGRLSLICPQNRWQWFFSVWPQNRWRWFLPVWLQNRWQRVFWFVPQNWQLRFSDYGLKITAIVFLFRSQNQSDFDLSVALQNRWEGDGVGHVSRSNGFISYESKSC
jgi:hypothetical protein